MITTAARAPSFASPLGPIKSMLGLSSDRADASCLGLGDLGQVHAPHASMDAVSGRRGDSLCCTQTSKLSATSTRRCMPSTSVGAVADKLGQLWLPTTRLIVVG